MNRVSKIEQILHRLSAYPWIRDQEMISEKMKQRYGSEAKLSSQTYVRNKFLEILIIFRFVCMTFLAAPIATGCTDIKKILEIIPDDQKLCLYPDY